jgi:hypothetical protein
MRQKQVRQAILHSVHRETSDTSLYQDMPVFRSGLHALAGKTINPAIAGIEMVFCDSLGKGKCR